MNKLAGVMAGLCLLTGSGARAQTAPTGAGKAGVDTDVAWLKQPTAEEMDAVWSKQGAKPQSGRAVLHCGVTTAGLTEACVVKLEEPTDHGMGAAALRLAPSFTFKPATHDGLAIASAVNNPITFAVGAQWLKKPTGDDLDAVWPKQAVQEGKSGKASISCIVTTAGLLSGCRVVSEQPAGYGFGGAALLLSPSFLFKPMTRDGVAVASEVTIPVNFVNPGGRSIVRGTDMGVTAWFPWLKAPSAAEVQAAYPAAATAKAAPHGHVVLRCGFKRDATLKACQTITEAPTGLGFARSAMALSKRFQGRPEIIKASDLDSTYINLAIDLPPTSPGGYINEPDWTRSLSPTHAAALFPAKAVDAKLTQGKATVDCLIDDVGALTLCRVVSEAPAGFEFGRSAMAAAAAMRVNLWTRDGAPTPGAHIKLPISLVYAGDDKPEPAAPADATPAKTN